MRVCLVSSNLHPVPSATHGAVEVQMMHQAEGLARLGHEVHIVTVGDQQPGDDEAPIVFHRLGAAFDAGPKRRAPALIASQTRFAKNAAHRVVEIAPEVVHWHARYPCLLGLGRLSKSGPIARIYHAHNWKRAENMRYPRSSTRRAAAVIGSRMDARIADKSDHLIGVSEFVAESIVSSSGVDPSRVSVLTNAVDSDLFCPSGDDRHDASRILFVGRIAAEKGLLTLVEAMPEVLRSVPEATLDVVGPDRGGTELGEYARTCKQRATELEIADKVRFAGPIPNAELPDRIRTSRLLTVPSIWGEPCGVVVLEGMACGVPVVASRVGGIPELLAEGTTGRLCTPGNSAAWAKVLIEALNDDALRSSARVEGPRTAKERHSPQSIGPALVTIYERVLGTLR